jgi:serine-type D-Ala-D-Ala carboxypeptidase/endopeptidase (penicillin-binding protein 4)
MVKAYFYAIYCMRMKLIFFAALLVLPSLYSVAQQESVSLNRLLNELEADSSLRHGIVGFLAIDAQNGNVVASRHESLGLAPASTQKIFTSIATFDLLGKDYHFNTNFSYTGNISNGRLNGDLVVNGSGDPSFGSWRWNETKSSPIFAKLITVLKSKGIASIDGNIVINEAGYSLQPLPEGWIWQDIGNYYGAGSWSLNWHENQYDLLVQPGSKQGDSTTMLGTEPSLNGITFRNALNTGAANSGDNGYIFLAPFASQGFVTGTVPAGKRFTLSGSLPDPPAAFADEMRLALTNAGLKLSGNTIFSRNLPIDTSRVQMLFRWQSPGFDSLNYWFLRKSINLYGEAFLKQLAKLQTGVGSTDSGVNVLRRFWRMRGIDEESLAILDGSGLSPQSRVTARAEVTALQYAMKQPWFNSFYNALPEYNGMKMKSGSIGGARAFAGIHTSLKGKKYVFSIIANGYSGSSSAMVKKMFKVLDALK